MKFPNLLATRNGRLATFFLLYITEGVPLGFAAVAMATQMRRQGASAGAISAFIGAIYLPWAFKWLVGPVVDVVSSDRFGRRRAWIIVMQLGMVGSLFLIQMAGLNASVATLTTLIIVHNVFAATQDVAIDALAVGVLKEDERGLAGGLTFAAAYLGQAVGGSGALAIGMTFGFDSAFLFCAAAILVITVFVVLPLQEPKSALPVPEGVSRAQQIAAELKLFVQQSYAAFTATRASLLGLFFAVLPAGAMALGLAMLTNLAVDLGFDDNAVSALNLWTTVIAAAGCVAGGWMSDRLGRRRALTWFVVSTALPTFWLAWRLRQAGFNMPLDAAHRASQVLAPGIVTVFWIAANVYWFTNGLVYGARAALFMDVSDARVAATQFTAYMALMNLGVSYSAKWQGWAVDRYGYPATLAADAALGLACLLALALMGPITAQRHAEPTPRVD
jgi:PAT family beta-lactamase induction signal transducer AmpG